jgi:glyoxylase-like metal-dependent hydrolase (beta-lactamase superfamily II)
MKGVMISLPYIIRLGMTHFDARVLPTPGHTAGSLTVITASGQAFVGDLAVNYLPGGRGPFWPPFGESRRLIRDSWQTLRSQGVATIYPAHGGFFAARWGKRDKGGFFWLLFR